MMSSSDARAPFEIDTYSVCFQSWEYERVENVGEESLRTPLFD